MVQPTFNMEQELLDEIDNRLSYGDSRSAWVRDAIRMKLEVEQELEEEGIEMTNEERREFVVEAVRAAVEEEE
jgi:metal-responsive CopG/Arc/MetJ family transcriptional regulator